MSFYVWVPHFLIQQKTSSPIESYIGHFQVLVIIHKAAINFDMGLFIWTSSSCANLFPQKTYVTLPQEMSCPVISAEPLSPSSL